MEKNASCGTSLLRVAAMMGSDVACCWIGRWHFEGKNSHLKDKSEVKHWATKAADGSYSTKHSSGEKKVKTRKFLEDVE